MHRRQLLVLDVVPARDIRLLADEHSRCRRGRLKARGGVHRVSHDCQLATSLGANGSEDHLAGVYADAQGETAEVLAVVDRAALYLQPRPDCSSGIVLVRDRCPEDRHQGIADDLVDAASEVLNHFPHQLHAAVDHRADLLWVGTLRQLREARQIGEQHGRPTALELDRSHLSGRRLVKPRTAPPQKLKPGGFSRPQAGHPRCTATPQPPQNRWAGPSSPPHAGHLVVADKIPPQAAVAAARSRSSQVRTPSKTPACISPQDRPTRSGRSPCSPRFLNPRLALANGANRFGPLPRCHCGTGSIAPGSWALTRPDASLLDCSSLTRPRRPTRRAPIDFRSPPVSVSSSSVRPHP